MKNDSLLSQIHQVPFFHGLDHTALADVINRSETRQVDKDGYFFMQGDPADRLFVLTEGRVKLCQITPDGQQVILKLAAPWEIIGGLAIVGGQEDVYPVCCMAAEDSRALTWGKDALASLLQRYPQMAINATRWMSHHVIETQQLFTQIATERVEQRVARTLLRLVAQMGHKEPDGVRLDFPITRQDLAEMSGTTIFTVSRILSQWEKQGLIVAGRERVTVKYPHGLVMITEDLKDNKSSLSG
jgi:CRP-like cAMP-binding protein